MKLLSYEAHLPLQRRVRYVGERIKWFFQKQKDAIIDFMGSLQGTPAANLYSPLYPKHVNIIRQNTMIKDLIFRTYDATCERQLGQFVELFDNMLTSTFSNPFLFLKGTTRAGDGECEEAVVLPSFEDTKERIPKELQGREGLEGSLSRWLQEIPADSNQVDEAVDRVQILVLRTYAFIRAQVCDQVELFAESFFKIPMMRRLEGEMAIIELSEDDNANYQAHRDQLITNIKREQQNLDEVSSCIDRLQGFKLRCEAQNM